MFSVLMSISQSKSVMIVFVGTRGPGAAFCDDVVKAAGGLVLGGLWLVRRRMPNADPNPCCLRA
jgi:hypothetical protein